MIRLALRHRQRGLSYLEVLLAVLLIAAAAVPLMNSLSTSLRVSTADLEGSAVHLRLAGRLENVLAQPFAEIKPKAKGPATPSAFSDPPGHPHRILVYVAAYDLDDADTDGNPFTGGEADVLWIQVQFEHGPQQLATLRIDQ